MPVLFRPVGLGKTAQASEIICAEYLNSELRGMT